MKTFRILVVDDQPSVLVALESALRAFFPGARTFLASSAEEAWEFVQQNHPDIVLTDILLPSGMSGIELCERIKSDPELATTYVILMTAFLPEEWQGQQPQHRANALLRKPFQLADIRDKVETALRALELHRAQERTFEPSASSSPTDALLEFLAALLQLRSPALAELAHHIRRACQWLGQHAEMAEPERGLLPLAGFAVVLGRLALPDHLLLEPLTRGGHPSDELMVHVPLGAATVCRRHGVLLPAAPVVAAVLENYDGSGVPDHRRAWEIPLAARLLRLAVDFEELLWSSQQPPAMVAAYLERFARQAYDPQLLPLIAQYARIRAAPEEVLALNFHELQPGMVLAHDLHTRSGLKLASAGTSLTEQLLERLRRHHSTDPIVGVIVVYRPQAPSAEGTA